MSEWRKGDRAKVSRGDVVIKGTRYPRQESVVLDGLSRFPLAFLKAEGWTIEKIAPPLPTMPGLYRVDDFPATLAKVVILSQQGSWFAHEGTGIRKYSVDEMRGLAGEHRLVRLVEERSE